MKPNPLFIVSLLLMKFEVRLNSDIEVVTCGTDSFLD